MKYEVINQNKQDYHLVELGELPNCIFFQLCDSEYDNDLVAVDLDLSDGVFVNSVHVFSDDSFQVKEEIKLNYNQKYELQKAFEWQFEENAKDNEKLFLE